MTLATATVPMPEITAVINGLRDEAIYAWRRQAQKVAVIGWRDSTAYPGALARFQREAYRPTSYGFSQRRGHFVASGASIYEPYVDSGTFRAQIAARKPISKNTRGGYAGGDVVTTISIDGGALNLLTNVHGVIARRSNRELIIVEQPGYLRVRTGIGEPHWVKPSLQRRFRKVVTYDHAPRSMREEFALTDADRADLRARDEAAFPQIVRAAAFTKNGKLKRSVIAKFASAEEA